MNHDHHMFCNNPMGRIGAPGCICIVMTKKSVLNLQDENKRLKDLLTRIYGWDMMDTAADGPYWRTEMELLGITHADPARATS